jgi:hypothetical protein
MNRFETIVFGKARAATWSELRVSDNKIGALYKKSSAAIQYVRKFAENKHLHPETSRARSIVRFGVKTKVLRQSVVYKVVK